MNVHEVVTKMDKLIPTEDRWAGKRYAYGKDGHDWKIEDAHCLYDVAGLTLITVADGNSKLLLETRKEFRKAFDIAGIKHEFLAMWNNHSTFPEIKAMFRKVIDTTAPKEGK